MKKQIEIGIIIFAIFWAVSVTIAVTVKDRSNQFNNTVKNPYRQSNAAYADNSLCIDFIRDNTTIRVTCGSAMFTDIYKFIEKHRASIKGIEGLVQKESGNGIWLLKSNILVGSNSSLTINSTDTRWLKIYSNGSEAYSIKVMGQMKIDSVKITSWDPEEDDYYKTTKKDASDHRAYISVMEEATGTTNVTNSELAYLGYNSTIESIFIPSNGLSYYGGKNSVVKDNNIHDNNFGFYSANVGGLLIENNLIHHNTYYGLDPHSGTHDMVIRDNMVYDNGKQGIICSQHCRNITIEHNKVYNSTISFSIDMKDSVVRYNDVYNQGKDTGISVSQSSNNQVYRNRIHFSDIGIMVINNSSNNYIYNNTLERTKYYDIFVRDTNSINNTFENNDMHNSINAVRVYNNTGSLFISNHDEVTSKGKKYLIQGNSTLKMSESVFPFETNIMSDNSINNILNIFKSGVIGLKNGTAGDITVFNTDRLPFSSRTNNHTLSIITYYYNILSDSQG
jgi:mannuronan 5-epimerase